MYCDFLSFNAGKDVIESYFCALEKEIELWEEKLNGREHHSKEYNYKELENKEFKDEEFEVISIFFGGGTPSFVDSKYIARILDQIKKHFKVREDAEITIEANPASAMYEKLRDYREAGINRLSIGAQSLNDEELKRLGRVHDSKQFFETFENARKAGFDNINIDVMSALPGQSLGSYLETIRKVISLRPEHISAYSLIIEEGTPFFDMDLELPDEETDRRMYHETLQILGENGYHRYEISNYALGAEHAQRGGLESKPGGDSTTGEGCKSYCEYEDDSQFECRHNKVYWRRGNYLGVGIGAASMVENTRWSNTRNISEYIEALKNVPDNGDNLSLIRRNVEELDEKSQMEEFMFLGLRLMSGIDTGKFRECFGKEITDVYGDVITKYVKMGLLEKGYSHETGTTDGGKEIKESGITAAPREMLRLTEKGLDVSNTVMADFLLD